MRAACVCAVQGQGTTGEALVRMADIEQVACAKGEGDSWERGGPMVVVGRERGWGAGGGVVVGKGGGLG